VNGRDEAAALFQDGDTERFLRRRRFSVRRLPS
jgi:hypothetical protein